MTRVWLFLLTILVLGNIVGMWFIYSQFDRLAARFPFALLEDSVRTQAEISAKLDGLQSLLAQAKPDANTSAVLGIADLLPDHVRDPVSAPTTYVSVVKNLTTPVPVYKEQAEFSAVLGQLVPEYKYTYFTKVNDWYLVSLATGKTGWVRAGAVVEVQ